jgi:hypothetical protein
MQGLYLSAAARHEKATDHPHRRQSEKEIDTCSLVSEILKIQI